MRKLIGALIALALTLSFGPPALAQQVPSFNIYGPIPPGANIIGKVGIDQTMPGTTNGVVLNSSSSIVGQTYRAIAFSETTTTLAANGTFTGTSRNTGIGNGSVTPYGYFTASVFADQAGTLFVEQTTDGVTQYPANSAAGTAITAGQSVQLKFPATMNVFRVRYTNGSTAQGKFQISTMFSAN